MEPFMGKWFQRNIRALMPRPRMVQITVCGRSLPTRAVPMRPPALPSHCGEVPDLISPVMENAVMMKIISCRAPKINEGHR